MKRLGFFFFCLMSLLLPLFSVQTTPVFSAEMNIFNELKQAGTGFSDQPGTMRKPRDLRTTVALVIFALLSVIGTVMLVMTLYAAFLWFSARGNDEQVATAQKILRNAVIGFVLTAVSYTLLNFVFKSVFQPKDLEPNTPTRGIEQLDPTANLREGLF